MEKGKKKNEICTRLLERELMSAFGCTEPIAVALTAAKAREILGVFPKKADIWCSSNIIKNVKSVIVPHSGGRKGIEVAAILGILSGEADRGLEVLEKTTETDIEQMDMLMKQNFCNYYLKEGKDKLYIEVQVYTEKDSACVVIEQHHTNIILMKKNGEVLYNNNSIGEKKNQESMKLTIRDILNFADTAELKSLEKLLKNQMEYNCAISEEGMKNKYGIGIWNSFTEMRGNNIYTRAIARAAAASEARMSGCPLPVVINSGSGNQGITVSVPVVEFGQEQGISKEKIYRALAVSNLVSIHLKSFIGDLSAFCGAVTAASGAGAGIAYLMDADYQVICNTITNTLASSSGIICDGAKSSCAAKIALSLEAAFTAYMLASQGKVFAAGEGIVKNGIEETIQCVGYIGRKGMDITDQVIMKLMMEKQEGAYAV